MILDLTRSTHFRHDTDTLANKHGRNSNDNAVNHRRPIAARRGMQKASEDTRPALNHYGAQAEVRQDSREGRRRYPPYEVSDAHSPQS